MAALADFEKGILQSHSKIHSWGVAAPILWCLHPAWLVR